MRRLQRLIATAVLLSLAGALAGCSTGMSSFDPTDMFDFLDTKKKLPGERKPVFPEGVPGLEQGVPKDLYKDNVERQQIQQQDAVAAPTVAPEPAAPKAKSSTRSRTRTRATAPAAPSAASEPAAAPSEEGSTAAAPPAPKPAKRTVRHRSTTAPPPDAVTPAQPAPAAQPQPPAQPSSSAFPAPLPSGSFQR